MGQVSILTDKQKIILDRISKSDYLRTNFYFTGGTALSEYYLQHRYSDDLDFFTDQNVDTQVIIDAVTSWAKELNFTFVDKFREVVLICNLNFPDGEQVKVDFGSYKYPRIEPIKEVSGLKIDSLMDIAINKFLTISQRTSVKDFVDLYYLLKDFMLWDLMEGVRVKFRYKTDQYILASDFMKVEDFTVMPRMIKPLTLDELKIFFRTKAIELGKQVVEE